MHSTSTDRTASDRLLFRRIADGSEEAFEELFHLYVPQIEPLVLKLVGSQAAVKDIIQEVFLQLWLGRGKLTDIESPNSWIFRMVYNRSYTWLRKEQIHSRHTRAAVDTHYDAGDNPTEEMYFFSETARLIKKAVQDLPPRSREIYLLREAGKKNAEIAAELGISEQTVKNAISLSLKQVRSFLLSHGIELPALLILLFF